MSRPEISRLFVASDWDRGAPEPGDTSGWSMYRRMQDMAVRVDARLKRLVDVVSRELSAGMPDDGMGNLTAPTPVVDNMDGAWATALITDPAQLGAGASAPVTFTHGLDVPVQNAPGASTHALPNVRWPFVMFTLGLKGANIGVLGAAANPSHNSVYCRLGDTITRDTIQLRVHSDLSAQINIVNPLIVEIFFTRAVR